MHQLASMSGMNGQTDLKGKRAMVTGGARGIGRAVVESLLAEGCRVAFCARTAESVRRASDEMAGAAWGREADLAVPAQAEQFVHEAAAELGGLDILVNNAGIGVFSPVDKLTIEQWEAVIGLNLTSVFVTSRAALRYFSTAGGGHIVNVSSLAGKNAFAGGAAYNASKYGLNGLSEALMLDSRYENVKVSVIAPGSVDTEFSLHRREASMGEARSGERFSREQAGPTEEHSWKIAAKDVAQAVIAVLRMPARTLISMVEMRPAKPLRR